MSDVVGGKEPGTGGTGVLAAGGTSGTCNGTIAGLQNEEAALEEDGAWQRREESQGNGAVTKADFE